MKKSFVVLALLAVAAGSAAAQAPAAPAAPAPPADLRPARPAPDQMAERRTQYLAKELGLSADQQAKLAPILLAQRQDMQAMRERVSTGGRQRGGGQDLKAAQSRYLDQIRSVLTPEQFTKFTQLQEAQREKMRERRQNNPSTPPAN